MTAPMSDNAVAPETAPNKSSDFPWGWVIGAVLLLFLIWLMTRSGGRGAGYR